MAASFFRFHLAMSSLSAFVRFGNDQKLHAFNKDNKMLMAFGSPIVSRYFTLEELQEFIVTIEKSIDEEPNWVQQQALKKILYVLIASLDDIYRNHQAFVEEAPSGSDLEEYMLEFSRAAALLSRAEA